MKRAWILVALLFSALAFTVLAAEAPSPRTPVPSSQAIQAIRMHPLAFEPNLGQAPREGSFTARTGAGSVLVEGPSLVWLSASEAGREAAPLRLVFERSNPQAETEGLEPQRGVSNYFLGNDASQWRTGVPHYSRVKTSGLYRGVDLLLYGNGEHLEFDLIFSPGTRPDAVRLKLEGADALRLSPEGDLVIRTSGREVRLRRPVVYQDGRAGRQSVGAAYALLGPRRVGLKLGQYDRSRSLVVDPVLVFSTYHGGEYNDSAVAVACDPLGNIYLAGSTRSNQFPTTAGAFQAAHRPGRTDGFVSKFDPKGATLLYSTYLGGTSTSAPTVLQGLAVDADGNTYLTGNTQSSYFPLVNAYQPTFKGGAQAFVTKLNPSGSALVYSTFLGGTGNTNYGQCIAVDAGGHAYVAGMTNSADFPTLAPLQTTFAGTYDGFLTKFEPAGNTLAYSTFLGGSGDDRVLGVAVDGLGRVFLTGSTGSPNFPTVNSTQAPGGYMDAFLSEVNADGSALLFSTYLGGNSDDSASCVALGPTGDAYVAGYTNSNNFPTLNPLQPTWAGVYSDAFLTRFSGGQVVFSTYLGGSAIEWVYGLAVDHSGNAYLSGTTGSVNFPTVSPLQTEIGSPPAYHSTDDGTTFPSSASGLIATDLKAFLADPTSPGRVFAAGGYDGVYKSDDSGATWTKCTNGLPPSSASAYATCLAFVPGSPARILAGIYFRGLYQSTDGGSTWVFVPGTGTKSGLEVLVSDPVNPNRIFMGTNGQGFHVSTDGGMTWSPVAGYAADATVSAITFAPSNPQIIFVGLHPGGMFKSTDGGATWNDLSAGLRTSYVSSIAVDPTDPLVVYDGTGNGGLDKSTDGGLTWTYTSFDYTYLNALAIDPQGHLRLWAGCEGGLYASADGGATWSPTRIRGTTVECLLLRHPSLSTQADLFVGGSRGSDAFLSKVSTDGQSILFSTFFGGTGYEGSGYTALDAQENILLAGATVSHDLPTLNPRQSQNNAPRYSTAFLAKIRQCTLECTASAPALGATGQMAAFTSSSDATECLPAVAYDWNFGDATAHSGAQNPSHAYSAAGSYTWTLTVSAGEVACSETGTIRVVNAPVITLIKKATPPFKIIVNGTNFQNGIRVFIDGSEWPSVVYKKSTKIQLTGSTLKTAVPKGTTKPFRFLNPDGGEVTTTWGW